MKLTGEQVLYHDRMRKTSVFTYDHTFKAIYKQGYFDPEALRRIKQQKPPHIVKIYKYELNSMLTEFINGRDLAYYNPRFEECIDIFVQICDGLIALHNIEVVHLDIKPPNIMLTDNGEVIIVDLDNAKHLENGFTADGCFLCSEFFSAPELKRPNDVDIRCDIYSLGATIEYLISENDKKDLFRNIVQKCKKTDPRLRYGSVEEVKADILCLLNK